MNDPNTPFPVDFVTDVDGVDKITITVVPAVDGDDVTVSDLAVVACNEPGIFIKPLHTHTVRRLL